MQKLTWKCHYPPAIEARWRHLASILHKYVCNNVNWDIEFQLLSPQIKVKIFIQTFLGLLIEIIVADIPPCLSNFSVTDNNESKQG